MSPWSASARLRPAGLGVRYALGAGAVLLCLLVNGCAGTVARAVSESDRDTSGTYDGWWNVKSVETVSPQTFGNWRSNCSDPKIDFKFEVSDGMASWVNNKILRKAFVDKDGRFRMTVPAGGRIGQSVSSTRMLNSDVAFVFEGNLGEEPAIGRYTQQVVQLGDGCKSSLVYSKV